MLRTVKANVFKPISVLLMLALMVALFIPGGNNLIPATSGTALTPPMGWMTWNAFGENISDALLRQVADLMVSTGMKDAGYLYLVIDDGWMASSRDANGKLVPNPSKFPNGMKALADYVHSKGLKLGIYEDAGTNTCAGYPGSYGHYTVDAQTFAGWGIDYLKFDWCNTSGLNAQTQYTEMANALAATGRPILFAACEWGANQPWLWARNAGANIWRCTWDIRDTWKGSRYDGGHCGIMDVLDHLADLYPYAGPDGWNDTDMLVVGLYDRGVSSSYDDANGCTDTEYRSNMSLWCLLAAPLITSFDLSTMNAWTQETLLNAEAIAVNQDSLGKQGRKVRDDGEYEVWSKELANGDYAVGLLNRSASATVISANASEIGIAGSTSYMARNLWSKTETPFTASLSATVASHEVAFFRVRTSGSPATFPPTPSPTPIPPGTYYLSDLTWTYSANGWGPVEKDMSNGETAAGDGQTITLNGVTYTKGLGCHAASEVRYNLAANYSRFVSDVGVDDEMTINASIIFQVWADGTKIYESPLMTPTSATQHFDVSVAGVNELKLIITDGGNGNGSDHGDWAGAYVLNSGSQTPTPTPTLGPTNTPTPSPTPAAGFLIMEAEDPGNTLGGAAEIRSLAACSGGKYVGILGNNSGTLQFNGINMGAAGTYELSIYYVSGDTRSMQMSVNGQAAQLLTGFNSGSWSTVAVKKVNVDLNAGSNTIKFSYDSGWAPDIDKIELNSISATSTPTPTPTPNPVLFSDGFESNNFIVGGWMNSGCTLGSTYKYAGTYAAIINSSDSLTKARSTVGYQSIQVKYARYTRNCETDDHFIAEWYDGSVWTTLEDLTGNSSWTVKIWNLPTGANNNANFQIRFRTSHNGSADYAYLDEVQIIGHLNT